MHRIKVYHYPKCSTCKRAIQFLEEREIPYREEDISVTPPTMEELKEMLHYLKGDIKKLFNTSGRLYREMELKDKLPQMSKEEALALLDGQGMLIKRPFVIFHGGGFVGFKEDDWDRGLSEGIHTY